MIGEYMFGSFISKYFFEIWPLIKDNLNIMKKWIYKEDAFRKDIIVDICNNANAVTIDLAESCPRIRMDFNIQNQSEYLDAIFDRAEISISIGYHVPGEALVVIPQEVKKKSSCFLGCEYILNRYQYDLVYRWLQNNKRIDKVNITVKYSIKSKLYDYTETARLNDKACRLVNAKMEEAS